MPGNPTTSDQNVLQPDGSPFSAIARGHSGLALLDQDMQPL